MADRVLAPAILECSVHDSITLNTRGQSCPSFEKHQAGMFTDVDDAQPSDRLLATLSSGSRIRFSVSIARLQ